MKKVALIVFLTNFIVLVSLGQKQRDKKRELKIVLKEQEYRSYESSLKRLEENDIKELKELVKQKNSKTKLSPYQRKKNRLKKKLL